jgi:hypothetical protein
VDVEGPCPGARQGTHLRPVHDCALTFDAWAVIKNGRFAGVEDIRSRSLRAQAQAPLCVRMESEGCPHQAPSGV